MNFERSIVRLACPPARRGIMEALLPQLLAGTAHDGAAQLDSCSGYAQLAALLDAEPAERLNRTLCLVDLSTEPLQVWRVLQDLHAMRPAWLAWRYPEIYWVFLAGPPDQLPLGLPEIARRMHFVDLAQPRRARRLIKRHLAGMRAWFDPWELRRTALHAPAAGAGQLGVVFDEEVTYAVFNGYLLYRQGMPACLAGTAAEFEALALQLPSETRAISVLEDVELNYADQRHNHKHLMPLGPDEVLPTVKARAKKFGFHRRPPDAHLYVSSTLVAERDNVHKPFGGLNDPAILSKLSLPGWQHAPPPFRHSAPSACQAIAAALLARARPMAGADDTVSGLYGALLALEAERLLAHQTYAMMMECIGLRQTFEALAECTFAGATDELTVAPRLRSLERQVRSLVFRAETRRETAMQLLSISTASRDNWRKLHKRQLQFTYGMLGVLGKLRDVYGEQRKVDEEESVLQHIRAWRVRLFRLKRPFSKLIGAKHGGVRACCAQLEMLVRGAASVPLRYITAVLKLSVLLPAMAAWIAVFAALYHDIATDPDLVKQLCEGDAASWLRHSAVTFLAMQQGTIGDPASGSCMGSIEFTARGHARFWSWTVAEMALGYLHLGVLVAVLVQKITRR